MYQASPKAHYHPPGQQMPTDQNHPPQGHQMPTDQNYPPPGQQMPANQIYPSPPGQQPPINQNYSVPGQQMPTNINCASPVQQMLTNQNYPPPGQHMPNDQNYASPGKQDLTYHDNSPSAPPKPPQQHGVQNVQYAQPNQQVPWQQYPQPNPQQQYAEPAQQPWQNYQQQQPPQAMPCQYYPQNPGPQYNPVVAPPFHPTSPHIMNVPLQPWSSELFDCSQDPENCLITAFLPCVTFGQIAEITDRGTATCATTGLIYALLLYFTGFHWLYSFTYRQKLRAQYSLAEDPFHDCIVHALCDPCALCQEYRELKNRGFIMEIGWAQNMQMQAQVNAHPGVPPPIQTMGK